MTQAFPLQWPGGVPRTRNPSRSAFGAKSIASAVEFALCEVRRMGGTHSVISTNLSLRKDGLPYSNQPKPSDCGVAIYFMRKGKQMAFACDRWNVVEHNIYAIGKTIEAMRGIERWGSADLMERAFTGFEALPAPEQWWNILGVSASATRGEINAAYRAKAMEAHPDQGGCNTAMARLNDARSKGLSA